jgi:hypothetical protein
MNDCSEARANEWLERYVEGTLPEPEAQTFEEHYFDCPVCLAELSEIQAVREQLRRHPISVAPQRRVLSWPVMVGAMTAIAATLLIAAFNGRIAGLFEGSHSDQAAVVRPVPKSVPQSAVTSSTIEIAQLADLHLPPYQAPVLRDAEDNATFRNGMRLYAAGNCAGAIRQLARVDAGTPDSLASKFYSGVCQMHLGNQARASQTLSAVANAGDSPQQESALYYLAQMALAQNDAAGARKELAKVIALHGDLELRAAKQLAAIPQAANQR